MYCNTLEEIWIGPLSLDMQLDSLAGLIMLQHSLDFRLNGLKFQLRSYPLYSLNIKPFIQLDFWNVTFLIMTFLIIWEFVKV